MQIFYFSQLVSLLLCILLWTILPVVFAILCQKLPDKFYKYDNFLFKTRKFEKNGQIYEHIFKIKAWKKFLPDGASVGKSGYRKKTMSDFSKGNLNKFLIESSRAELVHLLGIFPFWIFGLFLPPFSILIMFIYALAVNLPCIMAQRYNRPRIIKLLRQIKRSDSSEI